MSDLRATAVLVMAVFLITGCSTANTTSEKTINIRDIEHFIKKGSTSNQVREYLGTPMISGKTRKGTKFIGYAVVGQENGVLNAGNTVADMLTFGVIKFKKHPFTSKNVFFTLDKNRKVQSIKYNGYSYIYYDGTFSNYNLAERKLSKKELSERINYSEKEIIRLWQEDQAKITKKDVSELDPESQKYPECDYNCYLRRGAVEAFGDCEFFDTNVWSRKQDFDSRKSEALFGSSKTNK